MNLVTNYLQDDAPLGTHRLRAKTNWQAGIPDDACEATQYGETEDYSVEIVESLSQNQNQIVNFNYRYKPSNDILKLNSDEVLKNIQIYSLVGQKIIDKNINSKTHEINLSSLSTTIYLIKVKSINGLKIFKLRIR